MSPSLQRFGNYLISRRANGQEVEFSRSADEVVFLGFDTRIARLVELHILKEGAVMNAADKRSALDRLALATQVRGASFMRVLEAGEDNGVVYFASNLSDGEFAEDYIQRRGALPSTAVFCLMQQFLDDLVAAQGSQRLVARMNVANPLVTTLEDTFLQLRVVDYGFSGGESMNTDASLRRVFSDCCRLMFLMLTGQAYEGQNPDRFPVLTGLPTNLRTHLRAALANPYDAPPSLDLLREDIREAYTAQVTSLQARNSRKHIAVTEATQPLSVLQPLLLENVPADELLKGRFQVEAGEDLRRYSFSIPATSVKNGQPVTVHLLPPTRIVERSQMEAVPLQMWRFNPERHPNILRSLSLWENPEWTFLTEEREPGFTLSRLMAERVTFNPPEVLILLKQVRAGMDQAAECGVLNVDTHPSNLIFRVGKGGAMQSREFEKLITKRIDAWPPFTLKVRTHMTMRSLYEPTIVEMHPDSPQRDRHLAASDLKGRTFVGLAIYLLTGERRVGSVPAFAENVPDALAAYLKECIEAQKKFGGAPQPDEFIARFEQLMPHDDVEGRGFTAIKNASKAPVEEMESAGAVSDFENEWSDEAPNYLVKSTEKKLGLAALPNQKPTDRGSMGMIVWAIAAVFLGVIGWMLLSIGSSNPVAASKPETPARAHDISPAAKVSPSGSTASVTAKIESKPAPATDSAPVTVSEPTGTPTPVVAPIAPRGPVEIRKAQMPTASEIKQAHDDTERQSKRTEGGTGGRDTNTGRESSGPDLSHLQ